MILDSMNLKGKTALVTGAGRGIGRGVAVAYAQAGADVAVISRSQDQLNEVADEIRGLGVRALPVPTDVADAAPQMRLMPPRGCGCHCPADAADAATHMWLMQ